MIYLDSSAIMKIVREEAETAAFSAWLAARPGESVVSSELGRVEVLRAARRVGSAAVSETHVVARPPGTHRAA